MLPVERSVPGRLGGPGILVLIASLWVAAVLQAQERAIPPAVRPFVSIDAPVVALTHAQVVDGTGGAPRADQTVVVRGSLIEAVGSSATTTPPAGAQVIDLTGHTIFPGQVGLHEHTWYATIDASSNSIRRITPMNTSAPLLYLAYGVTTAMTAGSGTAELACL